MPETTSLAAMVPLNQIVFVIMTLLVIGGAIGVVASPKLFHSALFLMLSFFGVAGYYVLLSAGFLAVVQLMVYIGAIAILILFAIMFSHAPMAPKQRGVNHQWWLGLPVALILFFMLLSVANSIAWPVSHTEPIEDSMVELGVMLLNGYLIPFEIVSILLSVALIGAIILARGRVEGEEA